MSCAAGFPLEYWQAATKLVRSVGRYGCSGWLAHPTRAIATAESKYLTILLMTILTLEPELISGKILIGCIKQRLAIRFQFVFMLKPFFLAPHTERVRFHLSLQGSYAGISTNRYISDANVIKVIIISSP